MSGQEFTNIINEKGGCMAALVQLFRYHNGNSKK